MTGVTPTAGERGGAHSSSLLSQRSSDTLASQSASATEARASALQAWPNPTAGEVTLAFTGAHTWTVFDATGRIVMHGAGQDGDRLDLSGLDAGAYTVRLANGAAQRVVKH